MAAFSTFERLVAWRYLRARRSERFVSIIAALSVLGIALGVAVLIIVMSVMNGFRYELLGRIIGLNGHLLVRGSFEEITNYDAVAEELRRIEGVVRATPIIEGQVMATANERATGAVIRGVRPEDMAQLDIVVDSLSRGALEQFEGRDSVLVGGELARRMRILPGDVITLISPQGTATPFGTAPRMRGYTVVGTFDIGMYEYDSSFVFMPLEEAQVYFRLRDEDRVSAIEVIVEDPDRVQPVKQRILETLNAPFQVISWQELNSSYFGALQMERNVMFVILVLIILVAVFNIISSLVMLVKDKGRDIAVLRTMGASRGAVMRIFFMAGAFMGSVGCAAGVGLGFLLLAYRIPILDFFERAFGVTFFPSDVYFLSALPARVDAGEVITTVLVALGLSFLATLYPSWRAARLDPVEALRYE